MDQRPFMEIQQQLSAAFLSWDMMALRSLVLLIFFPFVSSLPTTSSSGMTSSKTEFSFDVSGEKEAHLNVGGEERELKEEEREGGGERKEEREMTLGDVSTFFYVPISVAAKELNMGLTQLKKKCRELGIPRWPHRKMKSLQALISNVEELGSEDGETGEMQLRRVREILERERRAMERTPGMQLEENTKRLRQACFKANFKKRRMKARASSSSRQI